MLHEKMSGNLPSTETPARSQQRNSGIEEGDSQAGSLKGYLPSTGGKKLDASDLKHLELTVGSNSNAYAPLVALIMQLSTATTRLVIPRKELRFQIRQAIEGLKEDAREEENIKAENLNVASTRSNLLKTEASSKQERLLKYISSLMKVLARQDRRELDEYRVLKKMLQDNLFGATGGYTFAEVVSEAVRRGRISRSASGSPSSGRTESMRPEGHI